jgi:cell division protease FtsH
MDLKRFTRGPLLWILGIVVLLLLVTTLWSGDSNFEKADTSKVISWIETGQVANAKIIDKDQRIEVTLTNKKRYYSSWVTGQGVQLADQLEAASKSGKLAGGYTVDVPK